ncbi:MAG: ATP-binding protein [Verrucomicrobia bacterium]|nr:ATP-binding protein [Verrucomicrobiota bacterium]MBS0647181.1 ATP-binding protein [Verrucomicrobiota bacterium]
MGKKSNHRLPQKQRLSPRLRGVLLAVLTLVLILSLGSYSRDYSPKENCLGYAGFMLGWVLMYLFGMASFLIPPYLGWRAFCDLKNVKVPTKHAFYFLAVLLSASVLLAMLATAFPNLAHGFSSFVASYYQPQMTNIHAMRTYLGGVPLHHFYLDTGINLRHIFGGVGCFVIFSAVFAFASWLLMPISFSPLVGKLRTLYKMATTPKLVPLATPSRPFATLEIEEPAPKLVREDPLKKTAQIKLLEERKPPLKVPTEPTKHSGSATVSLDDYLLPPASLLTKVPVADQTQLKNGLKKQAQILEETLASFGIEAKVGDIHCGPTITSFEVHPAFGVKVQKIKALENDLALNLQAKSIRIIAPIPGKAAVGIEIPNPYPQEVSFRELLENYHGKAHIPLLLGKLVNGEDVMSDLTKMPHLIIAGATGSGKSVCINTIVMSILMTARPDEIKLVMIDPKKVELTAYTSLPHMLAPVITEPSGALAALNWLVKEMERRYEMFRQLGIRNIHGFNGRKINEELEKSLEIEVPEKLPFIVVIIDELADLMIVSSSDIETPIARIAQMARAVGIHLILATQRPSREVITGLIKANFPTRIAFKVSSRVNSQIIIDENGAECLLGNGDMLFMPPGTSSLIRAQGAFIRDEDIHAVISHIIQQSPTHYLIPNFDTFRDHLDDMAAGAESVAHDTLYEEAKKLVLETGTASTTFLQRKLKLGYARAASLMDLLEAQGIIGPSEGAKPRKIFYPSSLSDEN